MTNGPVIERALAESFRAAMERGRIALFSAPCGFGKTVVSRALLARCGVTLSDTELTAVLRDTSGHPLERESSDERRRSEAKRAAERLHLLPGSRL